MTITETFAADIKSLPSLFAWFERHTYDLKLPLKEVRQFELALEETFVNIAQYAYKDKAGIVAISLECLPKQVVITFSDGGVPFNPLEHKIVPVSDRGVGGAGISLITQLMDQIEYVRDKQTNRLTLTKHLT